VNAQVSITTDGASADPSSMLHVKSTTKGVLISRMNTSQRISIASPADGLIVYDTDTKSFWYSKLFSGWTELTSFALPYTANDNSSPSSFTINNGNTGTGSAARFNNNNGSNSGSALFVTTFGTGNALRAEVFNSTAANAIFGHATGSSLGAAGSFVNDNFSNPNVTVAINTNSNSGTAYGLSVIHTGGAPAGFFQINNPFNSGSALVVTTNGTGNAFRADVSSSTAATAIFGHATGSSIGAAGSFVNDNAGNSNTTVSINTNASGSNAHALYVSTTGGGNAGKFISTNVGNTSPAVNIEKSGTSTALRVENVGGTGNNIGINLVNGYVKVDQTASNKTVYTHTANGSNISANVTRLNYPGMVSSDMIIVIHNFVVNYIGAVGVWWDAANAVWTIFREDGLVMPDGEKFNIMVVKQ
jgi:hypothetical protein